MVVVVELVVLQHGFAKHYGRGADVSGGRGYARGKVWLPSHPSIYIGGRGEGAGPSRWI